MHSRYGRRTVLCLLLIGIAGAAFAGGAAEPDASGTQSDTNSADSNILTEDSGVDISYAQGFAVRSYEDAVVVEVLSPWAGAQQQFGYVLVHRDSEPPADLSAYDAEGYDIIPYPAERIVTLSTTHLAAIEALDALDRVVAHDTFDYVYSEEVLDLAEAGAITVVGSGSAMDVERIIALQPDLVMAYGIGDPEWDVYPQLIEAGLPVVINGDLAEADPLGRAEWVKFMGLFLGLEDDAAVFFDAVEAQYVEIQDQVEQQVDESERPSVLVNAPWGGSWGLTGGESYLAELIEDAGGAYVWADNESSFTFFADFETVLAEAGDADLWIHPSQWTSLADGLAEDERYREFRALAEGEVYNNNRRITASGGTDYYESGIVRPHLILRDLTAIFHPELFGEHELYYYQQLQ